MKRLAGQHKSQDDVTTPTNLFVELVLVQVLRLGVDIDLPLSQEQQEPHQNLLERNLLINIGTNV